MSQTKSSDSNPKTIDKNTTKKHEDIEDWSSELETVYGDPNIIVHRANIVVL